MEKIEHVVVLMLENKSFGSVFGDYAKVIGSMRSRRARKRAVNYDLDGNPHYPKRISDPGFRFSKYLDNNAIVTMKQMENHNSGFVRVLDEAFKENGVGKYKCDCDDCCAEKQKQKDKNGNTTKLSQTVEYAKEGSTDVGQPLFYFAKGTLKCTHTLADHFVICDQFFASVPSATWPNRLMALSGTSKGIYETPMTITEVPYERMLRQNQTTIFDLLLEKNVSFKVYYSDFPLSLLLESNWKPSILEHHVPILEFYEACKMGKESEFPKFAWIEPQYGEDGSDSHPPHRPENAEVLIGKVYNALRQNEALWKKTLFIINYDECGGLSPGDRTEPPLAWEHRHLDPKPWNTHFSWNTTNSNTSPPIHGVHSSDCCCQHQTHNDVHSTVAHSEDKTWVDNAAELCHTACVGVCGFDVNKVYNRAPPKYCRHIFGLRVPALFISPWLKHQIDSTTYDHTSVLNSVCQRWGLDAKRLGPRVPLASTFWHLFDNKKQQQQKPKNGNNGSSHPTHEHQYLPRWINKAWHPHMENKSINPEATTTNQSRKKTKKSTIRASLPDNQPPNRFGLLRLPKHDPVHYSGQPGNWSHFQTEMFSCVCWVVYGMGRLPDALKHPLVTIENSWSTATGWIKKLW